MASLISMFPPLKFVPLGVIHLVRTHEGGRGIKQMRTNAYKGGEGLTHELRKQSKKLLAFCIHSAIFSFAKDPSPTFN